MSETAALRSSFAAIPWCAHLLEDPSVILSIPACRQPDMRNTMWARTLNTADTIPNLLALHHKHDASESPLIHEVKLLASLRGGLSGFPDVCHGGVVATLLDESMVTLILINVNHNALNYDWYSTASMNIVFMKPVRIPATVITVASITKVEERKLSVTVMLKDSNGVVLAKAHAVFVGLKNKL